MRNHVLDNRDLKVVDYLRAHLVDAEQFNFNSAAIDSLLLPLPPALRQQHEIVSALNVIDRTIDLLRRKRAVLEEPFNAILNKLMTGEIPVAELDLSAIERRFSLSTGVT